MIASQVYEPYVPLTNEFLMGALWIPTTWRKTTLYGPGPACYDMASFGTAISGYPLDRSGNIDRSWLCQMRAGISDWMGVPASDGGFRSGYIEPSKIVTFWDQLGSVTSGFNHAPAAVNVLFLDGHVETQLYDPDNTLADWPLSPTFAAIVGGYVANLKAKDLPKANPDCF
jgi:prepilin-type processing-associated H-X9-DG protein